MSTSSVGTVLARARAVSDEKLNVFLKRLERSLDRPDKSGCLEHLRQLFLMAQAGRVTRLPTSLAGLLRDVVLSEGSVLPIYRTLCYEILSLTTKPVLNSPVPNTDKNVPYVINLQLAQTSDDQWLHLVQQLIRWLSTRGYSLEVQSSALAALVQLVSKQQDMLSQDHIRIVDSQLSEWLKGASLQQAPNPYSSSLFKSKPESMPKVTEVDGTPVTEFFTILNIGQYNTGDQLLNVHSFSILRQWITYTQVRGQTDGQAGGQDSGSQLYAAATDYCLRVLRQCTKVATVPADQNLIYCCMSEAVLTLSLVCQSHSPALMPANAAVQQLKQQLEKTDQPHIHVHILQFLLQHGEASQSQAQCDYVFGEMLAAHHNEAFCFELMLLLLDHMDYLNQEVLPKFFPNIIKILAWNPRTFLEEFVDLLPSFLTPSTKMEVLHTLLDLPCMTAALVLEQEKQPQSSGVIKDITASIQSSREAYQHPLYQGMFKFMLRSESGHGDTIDRIDKLHQVLVDMANHPRVSVCSDVVPVLLSVYSQEVFERVDQSIYSSIVPVILERCSQLLNIPGWTSTVREQLSEFLLKLFQHDPCLFMDQHAEVLDFIVSTRPAPDTEEFYISVVWVVGEYGSSRHNKTCTPDIVSRLYEALEALAYELSSRVKLGSKKSSPRLYSVLMSTLAKLSSRCQDLIPRAILCISKLGQPQNASDKVHQGVLADRASELISLLQSPNVASLIMNPPDDVSQGGCHRSSTSLPVVLKTIVQVLEQRTM